MIRSYRYPLRPTQAQEAVLVRWLGACCDLYNGALQERRDAWQKLGRSIGFAEQCRALTEIRATVSGWDQLPCEVARSALRRLDRAFAAFFRRCKAGEKPGFPRFRSRRCYDSFSIGSNASKVKHLVQDGRVLLPTLGLVKVHFYRPLVGKVLDVVVRREADRWYVVFQCDVGAAPAKVDLATVPDHRIVGIDVGLTALATLSTGEEIANPRHARAAAKMLAARQRCLARKTRGSRSRRRALVQVQRAQIHVANQRRDTARKTAAMLTDRFDVIAFEDLDVARMVHGNLAFSIHDAGWGLLIAATICKAESAGKHVVKVNPRGTSQECSGCGAVVRKDLGVRVHRCPACGLVLGRDHNAGINIKTRGRRVVGLLPTRGVTAEGLSEARAG